MDTMVPNFEDRFFSELGRRFDRFEDKLDKNTELTQKVASQAHLLDSRVTKLETKRLFPAVGDKRLIALFLVALIIFLFIVANITKTEIPSWVK